MSSPLTIVFLQTPPDPSSTLYPSPTSAGHAVHARLFSWFLDAPAAPFGIHRMALAGKAAGKNVGMWFGPSAAASAIREVAHSLPSALPLSFRSPHNYRYISYPSRTTAPISAIVVLLSCCSTLTSLPMLVNAFPACGLGVSVATDGTLYKTELAHRARRSLSSSHPHSSSSHSSHSSQPKGKRKGEKGEGSREPRAWGHHSVLLSLGIWLGLDGVNPSVGIAGGRPSLSYYFVGAQGGGLFYLDPHHSRPCSLVGSRSRCPRTPPRTARSGSGQCMHTVRACDGGRTQSGGMRGVLTED
ncbi:hypothetical protein B0H13DRAFT_2342995 [Mycena leptocephala]|nr:hypothetical protein B0H13DRAFT_2342995 [Mycena leptocephala]